MMILLVLMARGIEDNYQMICIWPDVWLLLVIIVRCMVVVLVQLLIREMELGNVV